MLPPFHLAIAVDSLEKADAFYAGVLGCTRGRSAERWTDYNFFGHQLVCHLSTNNSTEERHNPVDGEQVPIPHFGVVLNPDQWAELVNSLKQAETDFVIQPTTRFAGEPGEQSTCFVRDPAGNTLEFKSFADMSMLFAS